MEVDDELGDCVDDSHEQSGAAYNDEEDLVDSEDENPFPRPKEYKPSDEEQYQRTLKRMRNVWISSVEVGERLVKELQRFKKLDRLVFDGVGFSATALEQLATYVGSLRHLKRFELHNFRSGSYFPYASDEAVKDEDLVDLAAQLPLSVRVLHWNSVGVVTQDTLTEIFSNSLLEELQLRGNRTPNRRLDVSMHWVAQTDPQFQHRLRHLDIVGMRLDIVRGLECLPNLRSVLAGRSLNTRVRLPSYVALFRVAFIRKQRRFAR
jgi:hypothetical protein